MSGRHRQPARHRAPGSRGRRWSRLVLVAGIVAVLAVSLSVWAGTRSSPPRPAAVRSSAPSSSAPPAAASTGTAAGPRAALKPSRTSVVPAASDPRVVLAAVSAQVKKISDDQPDGSVSAAVVDLAGTRPAGFGETRGMHPASVYKLLVLVTLLRTGNGPLKGSRGALAKKMIEYSDNDAGHELYRDAGCSAMKKTVSLLEMTHTKIACDEPTFSQTCAADFLAVLRALNQPAILSASEREYARSLMSDVTSDQRWGIGVVAGHDGQFYNKNGWLGVDNRSRDFKDDGRWIATSVGVAQVNGRTLLIAVFTQHQRSYDAGIKLVEKLARVVAAAAPAT